MKTLVLGAGAIGGYYGARLQEAGADVTFLVRPGRAAQLASRGLVVRSPLAPVNTAVKTISSVDSADGFELERAVQAIAPAMKRGAKVLPLMNGLSVYDKLDVLFGRDAVLGGVAYIATMLQQSGEIVHQSTHDKLIIGARAEAQHELATRLYASLARGPGERNLSPAIDQELWNKWVMLAAGAAVTCLMRGTVGEIMGTDHGSAVMSLAIAECREVATASGYRPSDETMRQVEGRLTDCGSGWAASMMRDIAQGARRLEVDDIVGDMLRRADDFCQNAALIRTALCHLQVYEAQHRSKTDAARNVKQGHVHGAFG